MKNSIILLAGGNSSRFGENKLLYPVNGLPMYRHVFDKLRQITEKNKSYELVVITRYREIFDYVQALKADRIKAVMNEDSRLGMSYSIKAGIKNSEKSDYYTFIVADQPVISADSIKAVMEGTINSKKLTGCITYDGNYMNPVVFNSELIPELLKLENDMGGKKIFKAHLAESFTYEVPSAEEVKDIDYKKNIRD